MQKEKNSCRSDLLGPRAPNDQNGSKQGQKDGFLGPSHPEKRIGAPFSYPSVDPFPSRAQKAHEHR
eukprot:2134153-Amphidinium_carterae.1